MCVPGYPFRTLQRILFLSCSPHTFPGFLLCQALYASLDPPASVLRFLHLASFAASAINSRIFISLLDMTSTESLRVQPFPVNPEVRSRLHSSAHGTMTVYYYTLGRLQG
jgi:hypothetical protein